MVATADIVSEIQQITDERSLLKHPFYQAWQNGELTLDHLRGYATQYWHHVLAFPQYVSAAHAICPTQPERQELLENLIEEERGDENHPELWLRFGEGVGATRPQIIDSTPLPETERLQPRADVIHRSRSSSALAPLRSPPGTGGRPDASCRCQSSSRRLWIRLEVSQRRPPALITWW